MKKIITIILFAAGTISFAKAQSNKQYELAYNKPSANNFEKAAGFGNDRFFSYKEKEAKLKQINSEFNSRIAFVKATGI